MQISRNRETRNRAQLREARWGKEEGGPSNSWATENKRWVSEETDPVGRSGLRGWEWSGVPKCSGSLVGDAEHGLKSSGCCSSQFSCVGGDSRA